jgi:hypothetical protein
MTSSPLTTSFPTSGLKSRRDASYFVFVASLMGAGLTQPSWVLVRRVPLARLNAVE